MEFHFQLQLVCVWPGRPLRAGMSRSHEAVQLKSLLLSFNLYSGKVQTNPPFTPRFVFHIRAASFIRIENPLTRDSSHVLYLTQIRQINIFCVAQKATEAKIISQMMRWISQIQIRPVEPRVAWGVNLLVRVENNTLNDKLTSVGLKYPRPILLQRWFQIVFRFSVVLASYQKTLRCSLVEEVTGRSGLTPVTLLGSDPVRERAACRRPTNNKLWQAAGDVHWWEEKGTVQLPSLTWFPISWSWRVSVLRLFL